MIGRPCITAVAIATAVIFSGCKGNEFAANVPPAPLPDFQGKVDLKYVGIWKGADGILLMRLSKDGTMKMDSTSKWKDRTSHTSMSGRWLVNHSDILFKYEDKSQPVILKYAATLKGDTLILAQGRLKTTYHRS